MLAVIKAFVVKWKLYFIAGAVVALMAGAGWTVHKVDSARYKALELSYSQASLKAAQQAVKLAAAEAKLTHEHSAAESKAQSTISADTSERIREVPKYVTTYRDRACVPYGLIRVLNASVYGVLPEDLHLPAGKSDDACAPVSAADFAGWIIDNFGRAKANAEQLDALNAYLVAREKDVAHDPLGTEQ